MTRGTIRLALIGVGRWGTNILRTLEGIRGCTVVCACATSAPELRSLPRHIETTEALQDVVRRQDLDGVIIATPASTHHRIALPFLRRGLPTFIEKPLATSLPDAERLRRVAQASRAPVFVGHIHLYNPAYRAVKRFLPHVGRIRLLLFEGMNFGPFRRDVSALWDWVPHDLAMALDLLGTSPREVSAWGARVLRPRTRFFDAAWVRLLFPGGQEAYSVASWLGPEKRRTLTVIGTAGTILFDDTAERKVTILPSVRSLLPGHAGHAGKPATRRPRYPRYRADTPLSCELRAFLTMVRTRTRPLADIDQGVAVVRILDALERSLVHGGKSISIGYSVRARSRTML